MVRKIQIFSVKLSIVMFYGINHISQSDRWIELKLYKQSPNIFFYLGLRFQSNQSQAKSYRAKNYEQLDKNTKKNGLINDIFIILSKSNFSLLFWQTTLKRAEETLFCSFSSSNQCLIFQNVRLIKFVRVIFIKEDPTKMEIVEKKQVREEKPVER